ncbi:MAG TPA: SDR family oxidoreductase [Acidimicrobiales bacterium]|nr:SDR family oxidoreductase [Acidimicrobiales bacterium]
MDLGIDGKVALVTGSYRGTGAGIAARLAHEGVHVIVHGFEKGQTTKVVEQIKNAGNQVSSLELDLLNADFNELQSTIPDVDILVNNYGAPKSSSWESPSSWEAEWATNVMIGISLSQAVMGRMQTKKWGRILFIGTAGVHNPSSHSPGYYGSKAALEPIAKSLAIELKGSGVTVNLLNPGMIATEEVKEMITKRAAKSGITGNWEKLEQWAATEFMPSLTERLSSPESLGDIVAFLVSDRAEQINGAVVPVDGGWLYA